MPKTINKIELLGRLGVEPEMRYTPGGTAITQVRLATDRYRQDGSVETDWHNVTIWAKLAEAVNEYVGKGDRILIYGKLVQNSYETQEGERRHRTEIHASEVIFLDSRNGPRGSAEPESAETEAGDAPNVREPVASPF